MTGLGSARLRPVRAGDHDWLYQLLVVSAGSRWRFRGSTPSPAEFDAQLWAGVHVQYVVCGRDGRPAGIVGLYNSNLRAGHSHVFAVAAPDAGAVVSEGLAALVAWAFDELELAKVWVEAAEFNLEQFGRLAGFARVEGRLTNHEYWRGRFWDTVVLSVSAETWARELRPLFERQPRGVAAPTEVPDPVHLASLLEGLWPLDSLGVVELLADLEELCDADLDASIVAGLPLDGPSEAAEVLQCRLVDLAAGRETRPATQLATQPGVVNDRS